MRTRHTAPHSPRASGEGGGWSPTRDKSAERGWGDEEDEWGGAGGEEARPAARVASASLGSQHAGSQHTGSQHAGLSTQAAQASIAWHTEVHAARRADGGTPSF